MSISDIEPVPASPVPRAVVYYYDNPLSSDEEPETGWYWGQELAPGNVDSYDSNVYESRDDAVFAAVNCDPTPLHSEDICH